MPIDTSIPTYDEPPAAPPRRRLHPLVLGTLAALISIAAGTAAALLYDALADDGRPEPEMVLRFEDGDQDPPPFEGNPGDPLPDAHFASIEGPHIAFAGYRGKPLVINLWASTCPPCVEEMPALEQVHGENQGEVAFLGLAVRDPIEGTRSMVERTDVSYDIGLDPKGEVFVRLGGMVLPTTMFVDAEGAVVEVATGELTLDEIRAKVEALTP